MYHFCPITGKPLERVKVFSKEHCLLYRAPHNYYLYFPEHRAMTPLIPIDNAVGDRLVSLGTEESDNAVSLVTRVDAMTVCVTPLVSHVRALPSSPATG